MAKFKIVQADPFQFKAEILHFWEEYLPGTPPARLEWMEKNPAGSVVWLFALEEKTGRLAGTISLFPKQLFYKGKTIYAAILGDFMLHQKFRVFGPALDLLKEAIARQKKGEFDFLYTVPNEQSVKIAERVGFRSIGAVYSLVRPQQCDVLLEKHCGRLSAKIFGKPACWLLDLFSGITSVGKSVVVQQMDWHDTALDEFCRKSRENKITIMSGDCSRSYFNWRYRENPEFKFQIYTCRKQNDAPIQGVFFVTLNKNRMELYDIIALEDKYILPIMGEINKICKKQKCVGVYSSVFEKNPLLPIMKRSCFFDAKDQIKIYTYPSNIPGTENWAFTSADRNI